MIGVVKKTIEEKVADGALRANLRKAAGHSVAQRRAVVAELPDWEECRERARRIKEDAIGRLPEYLRQAEESLRRNGVNVIHAADGEAARRHVLEIVRRRNARLVVKSKSMVTEEIGLAHALQAEGIRAVETDLGEYIVQLAGEMPSHITAPAIHKSRTQIGELFRDKLSVPMTSDPEELTAIARRVMREDFLKAEAGISGANFLIAETGTIVIVENEGNAGLTTSLPRLHIVVTGIEKVIPRLEDLPVFIKLLPRSATGQRITSYVSLINGPSRKGEGGADEIHVILLDNGRERIRRDPRMREVLHCIKCGACLNTCPVYQKIGGHGYGTVYPGPIGAILTPNLLGVKERGGMAYLSTLCGSCTDICPVKIDIHRILLDIREACVRESLPSPMERMAIRFWAWALARPGVYRLASRFLRLPFLPLVAAALRRPFPLPTETFHERWARIK